MNITSVKRIHQSDWTDSGVRFLRARDIVAASKNEEPDDYLYISEEKYEEYSALSGKVDIDDLLVTGVGTIGVPYLVENLEPLYFKDGNIIWFQSKNKIDGKFLYYSFIGNGIQSFIKASAGTGTVGTYTIDTGKKTPIQFPSKEEQKKIGEYLTNLDHLITLHQRKYFLSYNNLRTWEQRKFGDLYKKSNEKNDGSIGMDKNITVATMQYKEDVKVSTEEYLRTYYTFNLGDIAFEGHQSKEFRFGRFVENDIGDGIVSHIFAVFRPIVDYDLKFWKYAINNESLMQRVLSRSTKASTMMHDLVTDDFIKQTFLVPSVEEQKQIGEFLADIDNLITLHQRKCDKLKEMKKYMLQNMFPKKG